MFYRWTAAANAGNRAAIHPAGIVILEYAVDNHWGTVEAENCAASERVPHIGMTVNDLDATDNRTATQRAAEYESTVTSAAVDGT